MSEIEEFIATLAAVRQDTAELRNLIEVKAAAPAVVKEVQAEMARLRQSVQSVNPSAVVEAAERGAKAAAGEIREATGAMRSALQKINADADGWKLKTAAAAGLILLGVVGGVLLGVRAYPNRLMATETGCHLAGGYWAAAQSQDQVSSCQFFVGMGGR